MSLKLFKIQLVPTFFFCLRHPSQARPLGTPGIVESGVGGGERSLDLKEVDCRGPSSALHSIFNRQIFPQGSKGE